MENTQILIEILKQQRNQALDALAEAWVRLNVVEVQYKVLQEEKLKTKD